MLIFRIAVVIKKYIRFAFLYMFVFCVFLFCIACSDVGCLNIKGSGWGERADFSDEILAKWSIESLMSRKVAK